MKLVKEIVGFTVLIGLIAASTPVLAKSREGFTPAQIEKCFVTKKPVTQVFEGKVADHFTISPDGKWIAFVSMDHDMQNHTIFVVKTDGSAVKEIREPHGYKKQFVKNYLNIPTVINDHLYIYYSPPTKKRAKAKAKGRKKGIYVHDLNNPGSGWKSVDKKSLIFRITEPGGRYYLRKIGRNYQIQFTQNGQKSGKPLWLIKDFIKKNHSYPSIRHYFLNDEQTVFYFAYSYFDKEKDTRYHSMYAIDLDDRFSQGGVQPVPRLFREKIDHLAMTLDKRAKDITLYNPLFTLDKSTRQITEEDLEAIAEHTKNNSKIMALNVKTGKSFQVIHCVNGAFCREPQFSPNSNRFFFFAQNSDRYIYALFSSTFDLADFQDE